MSKILLMVLIMITAVSCAYNPSSSIAASANQIPVPDELTSTGNFSNESIIEVIPEEIDVKEHAPTLKVLNKDKWDKSFYTDKIRLSGVNESYAIGIIEDINPKYLDGINILEFRHGNPSYRSYDGVYYSDSRKIVVYVYDTEWKSYYRRVVLHELKHHYCLTKERNLFNNCIKSKPIAADGFTHNSELWDYCYHEQGCFLNTPIDKEYGFIK